MSEVYGLCESTLMRCAEGVMRQMWLCASTLMGCMYVLLVHTEGVVGSALLHQRWYPKRYDARSCVAAGVVGRLLLR